MEGHVQRRAEERYHNNVSHKALMRKLPQAIELYTKPNGTKLMAIPYRNHFVLAYVVGMRITTVVPVRGRYLARLNHLIETWKGDEVARVQKKYDALFGRVKATEQYLAEDEVQHNELEVQDAQARLDALLKGNQP